MKLNLVLSNIILLQNLVNYQLLWVILVSNYFYPQMLIIIVVIRVALFYYFSKFKINFIVTKTGLGSPMMVDPRIKKAKV